MLTDHLETIWEALACHRENNIPEGHGPHDDEWNDICHAMAVLREATGLPGEVEADHMDPRAVEMTRAHAAICDARESMGVGKVGQAEVEESAKALAKLVGCGIGYRLDNDGNVKWTMPE